MYFTIPELIASHKAGILGIKNKPNEKETENLKTLIVEILNPLREKWGSPIIVTSGYRCKELNDVVGGSKSSQHLKGEAVDIVPKNRDIEGLFKLASEMVKTGEIKVGQLIGESTWLHISLPSLKHKNQVTHV